MDTNGTENTVLNDPKVEISVDNDECNQQQENQEVVRRNRKEKWYPGLEMNIREIARELPILVKNFDSRSNMSEGNPTSVRVWPFINKRITRLRERYPNLFYTNSDVIRALIVLGLDIAEEVFINKGKEALNENPIFNGIQIISRYLEINSAASIIIFALRSIAQDYVKGNMTKDDFIEQAYTIFNSAIPEIKVRVQVVFDKLATEHGLKDEKKRLQSRLRQEKFRNSPLRLVEKKK